MGVKALRLQSISECEMAGLKVFLALLPPPAPSSWRGNRSRGSFPQMSLGTSETAASLQPSARFGNQETWSLAPFCGQSKCVKLKSGRLAEEVTDCGPVVDLKKTPGCQLLKGEADPKANYPDCCPVYDCEEGTEVVYVTPPSTKKAEKKEGE